MTLTTNGLNWLAQNAGIGNCFASSGINYRDADNIAQSGGTKDVVNAFLTANLVGKPTATIIAGTSYNGFKSINDNRDLAFGDVGEAADREADGGTYPQYCVGVTPTPPGGCTLGTRRCVGNKVEECRTVAGQDNAWFDTGIVCEFGCTNGVCNPAPGEPGGTTETPPFEVVIVEGKPCPAGAPDVLLDTSEAFAYFKAEPVLYVGVMKIDVTNRDLTGNECYAYFAWEMRMWPGAAGATCPITTPAHQTISRFLGEVSAKKVISVKLLGANEKAMIGGSFEIPSHFRGKYTLCLTLWGNFSKQALLDELLSERGYAEELPW